MKLLNNGIKETTTHNESIVSYDLYKKMLSKKNPYEFANELQKASYAIDPGLAKDLKGRLP
jgi:flagellum-specific peptidoglycan hydrolase FlgJ